MKNNGISGMKIKEEGKGLRNLILPVKPLELDILEDVKDFYGFKYIVRLYINLMFKSSKYFL